MGGLAGILHLDGSAPDPDLVEAMSARLAHRGPDGAGGWRDGSAAFSHRRRAIVPTRSRQPWVEHDLVVMLDGWIHDHLKVALAAGDARTDLSDVQVLALAWRRWGTGMTNHLDGAFALSIWDRNERTLHLVRDRLGTKPLYWARVGDRLAFASEVPALLRVPWVPSTLDHGALSEYLSFRVVHAPRTLIRAIRQVEPAQWLRFRPDGLEVRTWWTPPYAPPGAPVPGAGTVVPRLQEALEQSVRRRLAEGAPTALYLSGGLGSTVIAAAARSLRRQVPSFTMGFADDPNPEAPFAGRVARLLGLDHHEVILGSAEMADNFDRAVRTLGHPVGTPAATLQLVMAEKVRSTGARVVLSGDGGEELFGGRMLDAAIHGLRRSLAVRHLPSVFRRPAAALLGGVPAPPMPALFGLARELGGNHLFNAEDRASLLADPAWVRPTVRHDVLVRYYEEVDTDPINALLHAWLCSSLREESLVRADRTAAAAGLDVRFPLLDREVVEAAVRLPGGFKARATGGALRTRWPLRAVLEGVLPPPLVDRPKRGVPLPLGTWLIGPGRLFLEDRAQRVLARDDLFRPAAVRDLKTLAARDPAAAMKLWSLFILEAWLATL
jgi:asparagine synthase (glutamine-hydrolysing)